MAHDVTLITGDGTGPELAEAARKCIDATGVKINWDVQEAGIDVMARTGTPLPDAVMESVKRTRCALKAPITTPVGTGFRSINVYLRQALGLYACLRPCKQYRGVRTFFDRVPIDLVIVRENTESLYAGIEFEAASRKPPRSSSSSTLTPSRAKSRPAQRRPASRSSRSAFRRPSESSATRSTMPASMAARKSRASTRRIS